MSAQSAEFGTRALTRSRPSCAATRFTIDHEWITLDSETGLGTIGVTDYAQQALGDVVYVELPAVDSIVESGGQSPSCCPPLGLPSRRQGS